MKTRLKANHENLLLALFKRELENGPDMRKYDRILQKANEYVKEVNPYEEVFGISPVQLAKKLGLQFNFPYLRFERI